jgi:glutathione S-transferase
MRVGATSTPVLIHGGTVIRSSADILRYVDDQLPPERRLACDDPEVARLSQLFDEVLGVHLRRYALFHVLQDRQAAIEAYCQGAPAWQRAIFSGLFPLFRGLLRRLLRLHAEGAQRSLLRVQETLDEVQALRTDGRPFLTGSRFSAADLTLAALLSPLQRTQFDRLFPAEQLQSLRDHPVVRFAADLTSRRAGL